MAVENRFLKTSVMHHHYDPSIMFHQCSEVCMSVCWSGNTHSKAHPLHLCCCWLIVTTPESAVCLHYLHTHLPLLVPPQHLQPPTRGAPSSKHPQLFILATCPLPAGLLPRHPVDSSNSRMKETKASSTIWTVIFCRFSFAAPLLVFIIDYADFWMLRILLKKLFCNSVALFLWLLSLLY